jgi:hypothetical protein
MKRISITVSANATDRMNIPLKRRSVSEFDVTRNPAISIRISKMMR